MEDDGLGPIRAAFSPVLPSEPRGGGRPSGVLATLVRSPGGPCFLFERRPAGRGRFAGHLSFPGGRAEPEDESLLETALRESEEEVGFAADEVEVLGHLVDTTDPLGRPVTCYVGAVAASAIPKAPMSPVEVDELIMVPVSDLLAPVSQPRDSSRSWPRHAYRAVAHSSRMLPSREHVVQYWELVEVDGDRVATLWGFTGGLVAQFLHQVYDWSPAAPPQVVDRFEDLLPGALR